MVAKYNENSTGTKEINTMANGALVPDVVVIVGLSVTLI